MTKSAATQSDTTTVGAQLIAPEACATAGKGWREYELQELVDVRDGTHDSPKESAIGKHLVTSKHIKNGKIDLTSAYKISENDFELVNKRSKVDQWDILFSMIGTIGEMAIVTDSPEFAIKNVGLFKTNGNKLLSQWIYYYFKSAEAQAEIQASLKGSTQQYITLGDLREFPIKVPSEKEQKTIAAVLSSLDDKIDLLHRQNQTLEAMAQTLFRQWFIEEVREDWEEIPLSSIANFLNGLACQKFPPKNDIDRLPVLKIKDLSSGISENSDWASSDVKPEYIVNAGDVIFAWSASLMVKVWHGEKCILNQHLFKVTSDKYPKWFFYQWCKHHLAEFISISSSHATTMGHIKRGDLDEAMVVVPTLAELERMDTQMIPLFDKQVNNHRQIQTLTQLRDMLLPKLMSGEIRVKVEYE